MIELGNPPPNPPEVCNATGMPPADFHTISPSRFVRQIQHRRLPREHAPFGAETTVVNPALLQVSMHLSPS